jgi:hypothetical protein
LHQDRTKVGIGEEVDLSLTNGGAAYWNASDGDMDVDPGDLEIGARWKAPKQGNSSVTITAESPDYGTKTITFEVVEPQVVQCRPGAGTVLYHTKDRPDIGMIMSVWLGPDDVCFNKVEILEGDSPIVTSGVFDLLQDKTHHADPTPRKGTDNVVQGLGTQVETDDNFYCLPTNQPPPQDPGYYMPGSAVTADVTSRFRAT